MYRQRKFGVRTSFDFGDEGFNYGIGDIASTKQQIVDYAVLDLRGRGEFSISNSAYLLRWAPILLVIILPITLLFPRNPVAEHWLVISLAIGLILTIALVVAISLEVTEITFTEIPTFGSDSNGVRGFVRIIRDGQHDAIFVELHNRWRERMRALHYGLNPAAGAEKEEARLTALLDHEIITEDEHREMVKALHTALTMQDRGNSGSTH